MQVDRGNQSHLHNGCVNMYLLKTETPECAWVYLWCMTKKGIMSILDILNRTHRQQNHCSRSTDQYSTVLFGHLSHSHLHLVDGWPQGLTFWINGLLVAFRRRSYLVKRTFKLLALEHFPCVTIIVKFLSCPKCNTFNFIKTSDQLKSKRFIVLKPLSRQSMCKKSASSRPS